VDVPVCINVWSLLPRAEDDFNSKSRLRKILTKAARVVSGNSGTSSTIAGGNSEPNANITTECNTNIANVMILGNMDTQAEESAKRTAESPCRAIDEATPNEPNDSATMEMEAEKDVNEWDVFATPVDPMDVAEERLDATDSVEQGTSQPSPKPPL